MQQSPSVSSAPGIAADPLAARPVPALSPTLLCLCGDVMTGHGMDPLEPRDGAGGAPGRPVASALAYVRDAKARGAPLPRPLSFEYPWGDALALLRRKQPDLRLINLTATITTRPLPESPAPDRARPLHAPLHPLHLPVLAAFGVDGAVLANRHVLAWGEDVLADTLAQLRAAGIAGVGAGPDGVAAAREAQWHIPGKARVRLLAFGHRSSGLPEAWAAAAGHPGLNWLDALDDGGVEQVAASLRAGREAGDIVVVSLHWGSCWGYEVPEEQRRFAHALIDRAGVDLVWGLASHHPRPIEVHHGRLILYGVGDFLQGGNAGAGHEAYRPELAALYLPLLGADGALQELRVWPLRVHLFRLKRACASECQWLARTLGAACHRYGTGLVPGGDGSLRLAWH